MGIESVRSKNAGIEYIESNAGVAGPQRTPGPFAFKLPKNVLPFRRGEPAPLYFRYEQPSPVFRVCHDEVEFDVPFPIRLRAGKPSPAIVFKHG
jgi:hypothetical protein